MSEIIVQSKFKIKDATVFKDSQLAESKNCIYNGDMIQAIVAEELEKANIEFSSLLEQERKTSFEKGFSEGVKETDTKYYSELTKPFAILKKVTESYHNELARLIQEQEQEMLSLIIAIAKKVVEVEITTQPEIVLSILKNSLNLLNERQSITIQVNPHDWALVKENIDKINLKVDLPAEVEIKSSTSVNPGGCKIESSVGSIDADIETQFDELRRRLLRDESGN